MDIESKSFGIWVLFIHSSVLLCSALSVFQGRGPKVELLRHAWRVTLGKPLGLSGLFCPSLKWKGHLGKLENSVPAPGPESSEFRSSPSPSQGWEFISKHGLFVEEISSFPEFVSCLLSPEWKPAYYRVFKSSPKCVCNNVYSTNIIEVPNQVQCSPPWVRSPQWTLMQNKALNAPKTGSGFREKRRAGQGLPPLVCSCVSATLFFKFKRLSVEREPVLSCELWTGWQY